MKKIILFTFILLILLNACQMPAATTPTIIPSTTIIATMPTVSTTTPPISPSAPTIPVTPTTKPTLPDIEVPYHTFEYQKFTNKKDLVNEWSKVDNYIIDLFGFLAQLDLNHPNYMELSEETMDEIQQMQKLSFTYSWDYRWLEYPVATEVWLYITNEMKYSEVVAAGIIGNMMAECGGHTLKLDWTATNKNSGCYGLCQWHPKYHTEVQGADLQSQLAYMKKSFPEAMSQQWALNGYKKGFTYEEFLAIADIREAAKAFCLIYERPGGYNEQRGEFAVRAFQYFTLPLTSANLEE